MLFLSSADFKINISKNCFKNTIRVSNSLDPDQARLFNGPDLGPNCLERLPTDSTSRRGPVTMLDISYFG